MSFGLFILYILFTYLRPFETIAPDLGVYRPMLILWVLAFVSAGTRALMLNEIAARPVHFGLLGMLIVCIGLSQVANQWAGGALPAIADFSTAAMLMVLCLLNLTSLRRLQVTCVVITCSIFVLAAMGSIAFHTGFMAEELVLRQNTSDDEDEVREEAQEYAAPAHDKSGRYLLRVRSLGFLNDPNDFAQAMVMVLPMLWWFYAPGRLLRNLFVVAAPGVLLGYAILLTQSRGALLGLGYGNFTDHHYLTAHNSFVLGFAELGLVGHFAWLGLPSSTPAAPASPGGPAWAPPPPRSPLAAAASPAPLAGATGRSSGPSGSGRNRRSTYGKSLRNRRSGESNHGIQHTRFTPENEYSCGLQGNFRGDYICKRIVDQNPLPTLPLALAGAE